MTDINANYDHSEDAAAAKPTAFKGLIFFGVLAIGLGLIALFVLGQRSAEGPLVPSERPIPLSVSTAPADIVDRFEIDERFSGMVAPRRESQLGFSSSGRVDRLYVDIGARVDRGQTLGKLDTRALEAQLKAAEAQVQEARASYDLALATYGRQKTLLERGHVSAQLVDEAKAQADTAAARIEAAAANADALRVQIDLASIDAPFDGTITQRMVDEGAITGAGIPIFELVEVGVLEAEIGLPLKLANRLTIGETYTLLVGDGEIPATLRAKTDIINSSQRTVATVFDIAAGSAAPPGAVARIALKQTIEESGFWVPVSALTESERGLWSVYVARRNDQGWAAQPGTVDIIHSAGERAFVRGTVRAGDLIILGGLQRLVPGQAVTPGRQNPIAATDSEG